MYPVAVLWQSGHTVCLSTACEHCATPYVSLVDDAEWASFDASSTYEECLAGSDFAITATYGICPDCDALLEEEGVDSKDIAWTISQMAYSYVTVDGTEMVWY